jgi:soluble lytic murein transglycosylase-like protein
LAALLIGVSGALAAAPDAARAGDVIYSYLDDQGVTHFTNIPRRDARYQRVKLDDSRLRYRRRAPDYRDYDLLIHATALQHRLPPALVKAVIAAESAFDPNAVSHKGAQGLMQLMPNTAATLGVENAFEPTQNVRGGTTYLREMLDRFGDVSRAVAAYNAGPAAVERYGGIPPYRETRDYVDRVLTYYRHYHGDFAR